MNNQLLLIVFGVLVSCGMPVSSLYKDKMLSVISAEKTEWVGGRAGVKGAMYIVQLKKKNNSIIIVKTLKAEGNIISFAQNNSGNTIVIRGNLPYKNKEENLVADPVPTGNSDSQNLNPKDNWIEYTVKGSKISNRINIPKFISVQPSGDSVP